MSCAWLTPDNAPTGFFSRRVLVPANTEFLAIVSGALVELTKVYNFEKFGSLTPEECAEIFSTMLGEWLNQGVNYMIGMIIAYPNATLPDFILACDGSTYDKADYPALYDVLDATYQTSGTQFTLPDLRDRFIVGTGGYSLGDIGGVDNVTLTSSEMPNHSHSEIIASPVVVTIGAGAPVPSAVPGVGITGSAGASGAHENRPPYYALVWGIIAK